MQCCSMFKIYYSFYLKDCSIFEKYYSCCPRSVNPQCMTTLHRDRGNKVKHGSSGIFNRAKNLNLVIFNSVKSYWIFVQRSDNNIRLCLYIVLSCFRLCLVLVLAMFETLHSLCDYKTRHSSNFKIGRLNTKGII